MLDLIHLVLAIQLVCECPQMLLISFEVRALSQTLQLAMTVYPAMANLSPGVIIVCGFLVFLFAVLDIVLQIMIAIVRRAQNADRR
jgi:hypothetical protein